ncbi:TonB-dependent receptor [Sphingomonas sabuli]|uniref:TonB-dependent receptor n=1 Tax=Sphingomonas sabuli TaxID=2764186 RepID=A0A7G9KZV4_9SPHN|nr:TonB-dependent receptor [Sphingomonas sabuli]QNM81903.1 TonB-dependent receptor [Sphingomonas sabuli]
MKNLGFTARTALFASAGMAAMLMAGTAHAQIQEQQPPPQQDDSATDADPAEIIVTAQKREESILAIPQSVSVVGGDTLERLNASSFQDFAALVPGLSLTETNPGNTRIVLRGVNTGGVSQTVGVYVDETPFGSSSGLVNGAILAGDFDTFDVARLEVLRGPQGTLYGASSLGGVIKYVTNAPQLGQNGGRARVSVESVKGGELGFNVAGVGNAALGDTAALRVSGFYRKEAGFIDAEAGWSNLLGSPSIGGDDINDAKVYGGRAQLLFEPTDLFKVRLSAVTQQIHSHASSAIEVDDDTLDPVDDRYIQTVFIPEFNKTRYTVLNGTAEYDFGFASLLSSTSYARLKQTFLTDLTTTYGFAVSFIFGGLVRPLGAQQDQLTGFKKFTQEFRLTSPSDDRFEWLLGAYYTNERGKIVQDINAFDVDTDTLATDIPNLANATLPSKYREVAGFANATFHFNETFDLTGGVRLSRNKQEASQVLDGPLVGGLTTFDDLNSSESVFTYALAPRFELSPNTALYARVATGYRPGGPNVLAPGAPPEFATYDADRLTNYEIGLKTDIGRRLSFDIAGYILKWKDIQLFVVEDGVGFNANGGKATSYGLESTMTYRPFRGLQLLGNVAYVHGELDENAGATGGRKGDPLPWVPRLSASLNADYEWPIAVDTRAFVGGGVRYVGKQYANFDADYRTANGRQRPINPYGVLDLRGGVEFRNFNVEAYIQNLTDSHGLTSADLPTDAFLGTPVLPNGAVSAAVIRPRTIGVTLGMEF